MRFLAKKYYDQLFKTYCVADLRHFDRNKIGMRWRTETEVKHGKGQFVCGATDCSTQKRLSTWEASADFYCFGEPICVLQVNFSYNEHGQNEKCARQAAAVQRLLTQAQFSFDQKAHKKGEKR